MATTNIRIVKIAGRYIYLSLMILMTLIAFQNCSRPFQSQNLNQSDLDAMEFSGSSLDQSDFTYVEVVDSLTKATEMIDSFQENDNSVAGGPSYAVELRQGRLYADIDQPGVYALLVKTKVRKIGLSFLDSLEKLKYFRDRERDYLASTLKSDDSEFEIWSVLGPLISGTSRNSEKMASTGIITFKFDRPTTFSIEAPVQEKSDLIERQEFFLSRIDVNKPLPSSLAVDQSQASPQADMGVSQNKETTESYAFRMNAGGGAISVQGQKWAPDVFYVQRSGAVDRGDIKISGAGEVPLKVYQTETWCVESYSIPVKNGNFEVELHFAETSSAVTGIGDRVFDVNVEGEKHSHLDIFKMAGGKFKALVVKSKIKVSDETLNISFSKNKNCPMINGLVIHSTGGSSDPFSQLDQKMAEFHKSGEETKSSPDVDSSKPSTQQAAGNSADREIASVDPAGNSAPRSDPPYLAPPKMACTIWSGGTNPEKDKSCCNAPSQKDYGSTAGTNVAPKSEPIPCSKRYGNKIIDVDFDGYDGQDVTSVLKKLGAVSISPNEGSHGFDSMSIQKGMLCGNYKKGQAPKNFSFYFPTKQKGITRACITSKMFIYNGFEHSGKIAWGGAAIGQLGCSAGGCPPPSQVGAFFRNVSANRSNGIVTRPYAYFLNRNSAVWYDPKHNGASGNNNCGKMGAQGEDGLIPQGRLVDFEIEVALNDAGKSNGYLRYYIDGKQTAEMRNLMIRDKARADWTITNVMANEMWQGSHNVSPKDQKWCYDRYSMAIP